MLGILGWAPRCYSYSPAPLGPTRQLPRPAVFVKLGRESPGDAAAEPVHVPVAPSASVEMLQRDLGQLNYYEGPVNGVMTPQTIQSIKYLQRDARLPQTGEINPATSQALQRMLTDGNNQMAG